MYSSRKMSNWFAIGLGVTVIVGIMTTTGIYAEEKPSIIQRGINALKKEEVKGSVKQKITEFMDEEVADDAPEGDDTCYQICRSNAQYIGAALASLDIASGAIDSGDTVAAKAELEKAKILLTDMKKSLDKYISAATAANSLCPITGKPIDPNATEDQMRIYKGKKIGFSSPACSLVWDTLSDSEKDDKLKENADKESASTEKISFKDRIRNALKKKTSKEKTD